MKKKTTLLCSLLLVFLMVFSSCSLEKGSNDNEPNQNIHNGENEDDPNKEDNHDGEDPNQEDEIQEYPDVSDFKYFTFTPLSDGTVSISMSNKYVNQYLSLVLPTYYNDCIVSTIADNAFNFYTKRIDFTSIKLPKRLKAIGNNAFYRCNIVEIEIPNTVESIGFNAFNACVNLEKVKLPDNLNCLERDAFGDCGQLKELIVGPNSKNYTSINGVLVKKDLSEVIWNPPQNPIEEFVVPNQTKIIKQYSFGYSSTLKRLVLSDSVETIEKYAFAGCERLSEIVFNGKLRFIGSCAFNPIAVENIVIPNSVTTIEGSAFSGSITKQITLPEALEEINYSLFSNCRELEVVNISKNIKKIGKFAFWHSTPVINYPGTIEEWNNVEKDEQWYRQAGDSFAPIKPLTIVCNNGNIELNYDGEPSNDLDNDEEVSEYPDVTDLKYFQFKKLNDGTVSIAISSLYTGKEIPTNLVLPTYYENRIVSKIEDWGFNGYRKNIRYTSMKLPKLLKTIGYEAFYYTSLKEIVIPNTVESIDFAAFAVCFNLETVKLSDNLKYLGKDVFSECKQLKEIIVEPSCKYYLSYNGVVIKKDLSKVIWNPPKNVLKEFVIPSQVEIIGENSFCYSSSLERLVLSESLTTIEGGAFFNCGKLSEIVFNDKLKFIGNYAFEPLLVKNLIIPNSVIEIGEGAFVASKTKNVTLSESLEIIASSLFNSCRDLEVVNISKSIRKIEIFAFLYSTPVINYPGTIEEWNNIEKDEQWYRQNNDSFIPDNPLTVSCSDGTIEMTY